MKRLWMLVFWVFISLLATKKVYSQLQYSDNLLTIPNLGDANSFGFGGIFTTIGKGANALNGNPAGLARSHSAQAIVTSRLTIWGKNDFDDQYYSNYQNYSSKLGIYPKLLNISCSVPIDLSDFSMPLVGAIGYRTIYDISFKNSSEYMENSLKNENTYKVQGFLNTFSLGVGAKIKDKYFLGISLNIPAIDGYKTDNEIKTTGNDISNVSIERENWDIDGGTFLQFGAIWEITKKVTLGLSYMTGHSYKLKNGKWLKNDNGSNRSGVHNWVEKYSIPGIYAIGVTYKLNNQMNIGAEIQNCPWEDVEKNGIPLTTVESGLSYRLGMQYSKNMIYRLGFQLQKLPLLDSNLDAVYLKSLSLGINIPTGNFAFDISSVYNFTTFGVKLQDKNWDYNIKEWTIWGTVKYYFDYDLEL